VTSFLDTYALPHFASSRADAQIVHVLLLRAAEEAGRRVLQTAGKLVRLFPRGPWEMATAGLERCPAAPITGSKPHAAGTDPAVDEDNPPRRAVEAWAAQDPILAATVALSIAARTAANTLGRPDIAPGAHSEEDQQPVVEQRVKAARAFAERTRRAHFDPQEPGALVMPDDRVRVAFVAFFRAAVDPRRAEDDLASIAAPLAQLETALARVLDPRAFHATRAAERLAEATKTAERDELLRWFLSSTASLLRPEPTTWTPARVIPAAPHWLPADQLLPRPTSGGWWEMCGLPIDPLGEEAELYNARRRGAAITASAAAAAVTRKGTGTATADEKAESATAEEKAESATWPPPKSVTTFPSLFCGPAGPNAREIAAQCESPSPVYEYVLNSSLLAMKSTLAKRLHAQLVRDAGLTASEAAPFNSDAVPDAREVCREMCTRAWGAAAWADAVEPHTDRGGAGADDGNGEESSKRGSNTDVAADDHRVGGKTGNGDGDVAETGAARDGKGGPAGEPVPRSRALNRAAATTAVSRASLSLASGELLPPAVARARLKAKMTGAAPAAPPTEPITDHAHSDETTQPAGSDADTAGTAETTDAAGTTGTGTTETEDGKKETAAQQQPTAAPQPPPPARAATTTSPAKGPAAPPAQAAPEPDPVSEGHCSGCREPLGEDPGNPVVNLGGRAMHRKCLKCEGQCGELIAEAQVALYENRVMCVPCYRDAAGLMCGTCRRDLVDGQPALSTRSGRRFHKQCFVCAVCSTPCAESVGWGHTHTHKKNSVFFFFFFFCITFPNTPPPPPPPSFSHAMCSIWKRRETVCRTACSIHRRAARPRRTPCVRRAISGSAHRTPRST
jgi:hypothetical protein